MKLFKISLTVLMSMTIIGISAQENLQNKNGVDILPESGNFALGFNAVPFLNLIANSPAAGSDKFLPNMFNQNTIYGKYMLSEKRAIRASFNFNMNNYNNRSFVIDNTLNSPDSLVTDNVNVNTQAFGLSLGYEFRRGSGRVQAIFGGDLASSFGRSTSSMTYGNAFGSANQAPTSTTWTSDGDVIGSSSQGERIIEQKVGNAFKVGVRPFIGIEYFFAPKISIGAEFGWSIMYETTGDGEEIREFYSPSAEQVFTTTANPLAGSNRFTADIDNFNGAVTLLFYF
jgi:hypothetical protein